MAPGYGISSIGSSYANDPYFMYALNSYNPNFMGIQQASSQTAVQPSANAASTTPSVDTSNIAVDPSFKGSPKDSDDGISTGKLIAGGLMIAGGALACIKAYKKGDGTGLKKMLNGFKQYGKKLLGSSADDIAKNAANKADDAANKVSNIIRNGGKNLQEYTIQKDGMSFVIKNGKPVKIITQDKKVIDKAADVAKWVRNNPTVRDEVRNMTLSGTRLPKGVSLSYTREVADGKNLYRLTVENGQVVKASSRDKAGKWVEVTKDQFDGFIKNHAKQVKEAETLQKTFGGKKVRILNKKGKLVEQTGSIQMNVRGGKVVSAKFNGKDLKPEELKALQDDFQKEISNFGHEAGNKYGLTNYEYVYRQKGGQTVRFDKSRTIKNVTSVTNKDITNANAMDNFWQKNEGIKNELDNIISTGNVSSGFRVGNMTYKSDAGVVYNISGDKINGIKLDKKITLGGKTFKAGDVIDGKYLGEWRKTAENNNDFQAVLDLLKS